MPANQMFSLNKEAIVAAVTRIAEKGISRAANSATASAKSRAPVRKIFKGSRQNMRHLSPSEVMFAAATIAGNPHGNASPVAIASGLRMKTNPSRVNSWALSNRQREATYIPGEHVHMRIAALERAAWNPSIPSSLSAQGRYEIRSGRAFSAVSAEASASLATAREEEVISRSVPVPKIGTTQGHIGGSLRKSIHQEDASFGNVISSLVIAGNDKVKYARYVELGTRHAAAQPFLRPALALARQRLHAVMVEEFKKAGWWTRG